MRNIIELFPGLTMRVINSFGLKLKQQRESLKLDQQQLADIIGADQPTISRWENDRLFPSKPYQLKLQSALKVDESFFEGNWEQFAPYTEDILYDLKKKVSDLEVEVQKIKSPHAKYSANPDHERILGAWDNADPHGQAIALFWLTGDEKHLDDPAVTKEFQRRLLDGLRHYKMKPARKTRALK